MQPAQLLQHFIFYQPLLGYSADFLTNYLNLINNIFILEEDEVLNFALKQILTTIT